MADPYQHNAPYIKEWVSPMAKPYQNDSSSGEEAPSPVRITGPYEHSAPSGARVPRVYRSPEDEAPYPAAEAAPSPELITRLYKHIPPSSDAGPARIYGDSQHEGPYPSVKEAQSTSQITSLYERFAPSDVKPPRSYEDPQEEPPYRSIEAAPLRTTAPQCAPLATERPLDTPPMTVSFQSAPTAVVQPHASPEEADHDDASQLVDGLIDHLAHNLQSSGFVNDILVEETRASLDRCGKHAVSSALSSLARKFAVHLVDQFPAMLAKQLEGSSAPRTSTEYHRYLDDFVGKNLGKAFGGDDRSVKNLAREAADKVPAIRSRFNLSTEQATELVALGLYDFVIMCDDSQSMQQDDRLEALADTLQRVTDIATLLTPDGLSVRFLHCDERLIGRSLNHLTSREQVQDVSDRMRLQPHGTPLGTMLRQKIVEPLIIGKLEQRSLKKPVIVIMITDGEANSEPKNQLRDTIRDCKRRLQAQGYGKATAMFIISRVGNSDGARRFIDGIGDDPEVGSMVYTNTEDICRKRELFDTINDARYTKWLIELFLAALRGQTN